MNFRCLFAAIIFLAPSVQATPQELHPLSSVSRDEALPAKLVFEKVYLHLDRGRYFSGEDLWYKAYLVDAKWNKLSDHSRNLYVELVSPGREILDQQIIRLEMGTGSGDFHLGDSLPSGTYLVRAYTNWMRNFGIDFVFHREIMILNPDDPVHPSVKPSQVGKDEMDIQFFPEGGSLVAGVPARVGFKAVDVTGKGCRVEGFVLTRDGDTVARIESTHLGMGSFYLLPAKGIQYHAIISTGDASVFKVDLPGIFEGGYVLNVNESNQDELIAIIKTNRQTFAMNDTLPVYLEVRTGEGNFLVRMDLTYLAQSITLLKESFPPGIAHLILYDADFNPHCERLVYIEPPPIRIMVESNKSVYSPREKTVLKVSAIDKNNAPVNAEMSLAVVDASAVSGTATNPSNFQSYLLLESGLRGTIENPGYYFNDDLADRYKKMDLLLLTQGWRDFIWKYLSDTTIDILYPAEQGLTITGRLLTALGKKPMVDASISMVKIGESNSSFKITTTDSLGIYRVGNLDIQGSEHLIVSAMDRKGRARGLIQLDSIYRPDVEVEYLWKPTGFQQQNALGEYIEDESLKRNIFKQYNLSDTISIEEVMITTRRRIPKDGHQRIYGTADNVIEVTDLDTYYSDIFEMIQGKVPGVTIHGQFPDYIIYIRGISNLRGDSKPLFLLDGMPVEMEVIINIPVPSVDKIEVLKNISNTALYGSRGANGVISVFTKMGEYSSEDRSVLNSINGVIRGYHEERIFYAPRYDKPRPEHQVPDLRTTIHWDPFVQIADTGIHEISFFNADIPATINIALEGITKDGIPLFFRKSYQVK